MCRESEVPPAKGSKEAGRGVGSRATFVKAGEAAAGFKGDGKDLALRRESLTQERAAETAGTEARAKERSGVQGGRQMLVRRCGPC